MTTREAARRWAEVWERGWREHDAAAIRALYAPDAFWSQHPFREPDPGYLERVFAGEESAECEFREPLVDGDRAVVERSARTRLRDGGTEELAGVSLLRFDADGLVVEQRDVWAGLSGRSGTISPCLPAAPPSSSQLPHARPGP